MAKTLSFTATFGLVEGYDHNNDTNIDLEQFAFLWQRVMQDVFERDNLLVGCVIHDSRTIYPIGFGCPPNGEKTVTVTGHFNPKFIPDNDPNYLDKLKFATVSICRTMKENLRQTTVSIAFSVVDDFVYLSSKEDSNE